MVTTSLFSIGAKLRMAAEWFSRAGNHQDESVAAFVRRHFGQQMVDRVAEPLLAGVYGGSAERLSVRAVLPRFVEMERQHGSLVRATLKAMKKAGNTSPQPLFTSLKNGMQQLVNALVAGLPETSLRLNQQQVSLRRLDGGWQVGGSGTAEIFNAVFMAIPAPLTSAVVLPVDPRLAGLLGKIQYTSSAAVLLAYQKPALPPGFGFLAPASEGRKMLACTFVHNKFPHRAPEGTALLRCFFTSSRVQN